MITVLEGQSGRALEMEVGIFTSVWAHLCVCMCAWAHVCVHVRIHGAVITRTKAWRQENMKWVWGQ